MVDFVFLNDFAYRRSCLQYKAVQVSAESWVGLTSLGIERKREHGMEPRCRSSSPIFFYSCFLIVFDCELAASLSELQLPPLWAGTNGAYFTALEK